MDIKKKLEEVKKTYDQKFANLRQTESIAAKLRTECINLEGQMSVLEELLKSNKK